MIRLLKVYTNQFSDITWNRILLYSRPRAWSELPYADGGFYSWEESKSTHVKKACHHKSCHECSSHIPTRVYLTDNDKQNVIKQSMLRSSYSPLENSGLRKLVRFLDFTALNNSPALVKECRSTRYLQWVLGWSYIRTTETLGWVEKLYDNNTSNLRQCPWFARSSIEELCNLPLLNPSKSTNMPYIYISLDNSKSDIYLHQVYSA